MDQINSIDRATTPETLREQVGRAPEWSIVLTFDEREVFVQVFPMVTGTQVMQTYTQYGTQYSEVPVTEEYMFIFEEGTLLNWGFLAELKREDDQFVNLVADGIEQKLKERELKSKREWSK